MPDGGPQAGQIPPLAAPSGSGGPTQGRLGAEVKPGPKDFRYKYSTALELLGTAQSPTYGHPRLLGRCYDNVYHQGRFIGKLTARGHPPTEDNTKEVYNREYAEVCGRVQNSQDLDDLSAREFSVPYNPIPCSLKNPDIILHPEEFAKRRNLPPPAPGRQKPARDYEVDGAVAMVDVSWSQRIPDLEEDDIDRDPRYNQYPYQEGDELDEEEDMDTAEATATGTGAPPPRAYSVGHRPEAEYESGDGGGTPGFTPRSTHTDTDAATEFDTLRVGTPHPEHRHVALPTAALREPCEEPALTDPLAAFSQSVGQAAARLVTTQMFGRFHDPATASLQRPAAVSDEAEKALREWFHQRRLAQAQTQRSREATSTAGRGSVFQRLGAPVQDERFQIRPEMTPRRVERGRQQGRGPAAPDKPASRSQSGQKRRSASRGRDEVDPKKEKRDGGPVGATAGKDKRVGTGINWQTAVIEKPARKASQHPSFKPDRGGATKSPPEPKVKSAVVAKNASKASESSGRRSQTPSRSPQKKGRRQAPPGFRPKGRELTEKEIVRDQAHHWVAQRADRLDPEGYVEEANSLQFFGHNKVLYGLEMVAIIDWARKYLDLGMVHPLPILPVYLFSSFVASRQTANSPLVKDESIYSPTDDIRERFKRGWVLTAAVLQFWTDEQSILDGLLNGGRVHPASALARYVMDQLNPAVPEDLIITWNLIVERTPWSRMRLNCTEDESRAISRQPIPVPGEASELELATEAYYKQQVAEQFTAAVGASGQKSTPSETTPRKPKGRGAVLRAHVGKMDMGEGWTRHPGKPSGPDVGRPYEPRRRLTDADPTRLDSGAANTGDAPDLSPLTLELDPQSEVTKLLDDYDDAIDQDPEVASAVASILPPDAEMRDETAPGTEFNPELIQHGFDPHFGRGTGSPVTPRDDELLDSPGKKTKKAPGDGRPGSSPNSGQESAGQS